MDISRQDLYARVWSTPLVRLSKEFGISDVGLSKACRRHAIPTPPPGYWTRLEHGKASPRPPLPAAPHGDAVTVSLERSEAQRLPAPAPASAPASIAVHVTSEPENLAPFAKSTLTALSKAKPSSAGLVSSGGASHFQCLVSSPQVQRSAFILDAIERKVSELGGTLVKGTDKKPLALDFGGQPVTFTLTERYTRTQFIPQSERKSLYPRKEYAYHLIGELKLAIEGHYDGRKTWSDGSRAKLEDKLPEVLAGVVAASAAMKRLAEERAEQSRRWEEEARIRQEVEETARRRAAFRESFAAEAAGWQRHQAAAEYLARLLKAAEAHPELPQLSAEWLEHAKQAVADLDPTGRRLQLLHEGVKPDWHGPFGAKLVEDKRLPSVYG
jgi:hypothetical protein